MTVRPLLAPQEGVRPTRFELVLAGITLFMFTEAFLSKLFSPPPDVSAVAADGNAFLRDLWIPFYGLILIGLLLAGWRSLKALAVSPLVVGLMLMAAASALWSIDPGLSQRRAVAVILTTLMGVYMAARFDWQTALRLLAGMWFAVLAVTLVSGLVAPHFAIMDEVHPGAWSGGWWEKNQLGGHAARAVFLFAFLAWRDVSWRRGWLVASALGLLLVALSTSVTAQLATLIGFAVLASAWWMVRGWRRSILFVWLCGSAVGGFLVAYLVAPGALLGLIGRDASFTGRTDIWTQLFAAIRDRPWLGYGYQAFWAEDSAPRYWLQKAVEWAAPSGHNGWLDLAVSLGLVGATLFAVDFLLAFGRAIRASSAAPVGVFAIGVLAQFLLFSMSESIILVQNTIVWMTYVMVSVKLALDGAGVVSGAPAGEQQGGLHFQAAA